MNTTFNQDLLQSGTYGANPAQTTSTAAIQLYSVRTITAVTVLLNAPAGLVLAALNWRWLGRTEAAIGACCGALAITVEALFFPLPVVGLTYVATAIIVRIAMAGDIEDYQARWGAVGTRSWLEGLCIALLATVVLIALVVIKFALVAAPAY